MKVMIISENPDFGKLPDSGSSGTSLEFIRYLSPLKAMDNLDEIDPDVVLFNAIDYPRHWKPFLFFLRGTRDRHRTIFIVRKGPRFTTEDAAEASFLGVNGIIDDEASADTIRNAMNIIERYRKNPSGAAGDRITENEVAAPAEPKIAKSGLLFAHPFSGKLISGFVEPVSEALIRFIPDADSSINDLKPGQKILQASLREETDISTVDLKVENLTAEILFTVIREKGLAKQP